MNTTQGPFFVVKDIAICDRYPEHEITLVTDGHQAYAYGGTTDASTVARKGPNLTTVCNQPVGHDEEPCDGVVSFRMDVEGVWTTDPEAIQLLADYGQPVEIED